jgi:hypothetical protein
MSMETKKPLKDGHDAEEPRYEKRDANLPALLQFGFWLAIVIAVAVIGMKYTLNYFQKAMPEGKAASPMSDTRVLPPRPRLQTQPRQELHDYCADQQQNVKSYSWVDEHNGIVQIPVDRAMELVLERGLPIRSASQAPAGSAGIHQVGSYDAPLPAGVEGPCGYLIELDKKAESSEEPKE